MQTLKLVRCEWKCFAFLNNCQNFVTENFKLEMQTFAQFSKTLQHLALQSYTDHSTIPYTVLYSIADGSCSVHRTVLTVEPFT